jgi:hypothetical protein
VSDYEDFMREYTSNYDEYVKHYPYSMPVEALAWRDVEELKAAVTSSGSNFFRPDTMKFWRSRVASDLTGVPGTLGGIFFITSETNYDHTGRVYSVRWTYRAPDDQTSMIQVSRFDWEGATLAQARAFAKRAAKAVASHKVEGVA